MYVITQAVRKWRQYLLSRRFIIITDQKFLRELTQQVIQTSEQQKWLTKLIGFDFEIKYRPGKLNTIVDALSHEVGIQLMALTRSTFGILEDIHSASIYDSELCRIREQIHIKDLVAQGYNEQVGLIL